MDPTQQIEDITQLGIRKRTVCFPPGRESWFSPERVEYISRFAEALFFLIGIPWLLLRLFTKPMDTMRIVGAAQAGS